MNSVLKNIATRRSISKMLEKDVEKSLIEEVIKAGCWAPNHKRTEPWRFVVFQGEGRNELQQAMIMGTAREHKHLSENELAFKLEKMRGKAFRAPVVIAVWSAVGRAKLNPPMWEDHAAVAACVQNMTLAAHSLGLASIWRSGSLTTWPEIQALCTSTENSFDAQNGDMILGFLYLGHPDPQAKTPTREEPEFETKTRWVGK